MHYLITDKGNKLYFSDEDFEAASQFKWVETKTRLGVLVIRAILKRKYESYIVKVFKQPKGTCVINRSNDKYNLTRENLVFCDRKTSCYHYKSNWWASKYYGVVKVKTRNNKDRWGVICHESGGIRSYETEIDAAIIADLFSIRLP